MFEITVDKTSLGKSKNPHMSNFIASIPDSPPIGVYTTNVVSGSDEKRRFFFVTTSKDAHLDLGRLNQVAQYYLAKILQWEFEKKKDATQLVLTVPKTQFLVVQKSEGDDITFFLSPIR